MKLSPRAPNGVVHSLRASFKTILRDPLVTSYLSSQDHYGGSEHRRSLLQVKIAVFMARAHIMVRVTHCTPQAPSFLKRTMRALPKRTPQPWGPKKWAPTNLRLPLAWVLELWICPCTRRVQGVHEGEA